MRLATLFLSGLVAVCGAVSASAQSAIADDIPRTFEGRPDFSGSWTSRGLTTMERPGAGPLVVDDEGAAVVALEIYEFLRSAELDADIDPDAIAADNQELLKVGGEWRTSLVTLPDDGKLPLSEAGKERIRIASGDWGLDGPEGRPPFERCLTGTGNAPLYQVPSWNARRLVQTADHVLIYSDEGGDLRELRINGAPRPKVTASRYGDSIARWDGDVLVVETLNLTPFASGFPWGVIAVDADSRIVERLRLLGPDELLYQFTVVDEELYSEPWSAEFSMKRTDTRVYEYACHEGNYSIVNILRAARIAER